MTTVRVLVAEDHPMFRDGLASLLSADDRFELVAAVADAGAAIDVLAAEPIDVAVVDLAMPGGGGAAVLRAIRAEPTGTRVLVLTSYDSEGEILAALDLGAQSYLVKTASPDEILAAVVATAAGASTLSPSALDVLSRRRDRPAGAGSFPELTDRERDVLAAMAEGLDNVGIARRLGLTEKTVRNYVSNVLTKLGVSHRAAAVVEAQRRGLGAG